MNTTVENYVENAASDARDTVSNFEDEILEQLMDKGEASDDLNNDYANGDGYHHECHVDKWYNLTDATAVLDQLDEFEETDSGLWEGQDMRTAVATCAAYTYGNAVYSEWCDLIKSINGDTENVISDFDAERNDLESDIETLNDEAGDLDDEAAEADGDGDNDNAASLKAEAEAKRSEAREKQGELDTLDDRKKDALLKIIRQHTQN